MLHFAANIMNILINSIIIMQGVLEELKDRDQ